MTLSKQPHSDDTGQDDNILNSLQFGNKPITTASTTDEYLKTVSPESRAYAEQIKAELKAALDRSQN